MKTQVKERPVIFSAEDVRAILDGRTHDEFPVTVKETT